MTPAELFAATGLIFRTVDEAHQFYDAHKPDDAPEFSDAVLPFLRDCTNPRKQWADITTQRAMAEDAGKRAADPTLPIFGPNKFEVQDDTETIIEESCTRALDSYATKGIGSVAGDVLVRLAKLTSHLQLVPVTHDPNTAEFLWSRLRVLFSGGGYTEWSECAAGCGALYPNCPWQSDETEEEWQAALLEAHTQCGWPVQLAHLRWSDACRCVHGESETAFNMRPWYKVIAALHVLKHVRLAPDGSLHVLYGGVATRIELQPGNAVVGQSPVTKKNIMFALRAGNGSKNDGKNPLKTAVAWILDRLQIHQLIRLVPISELPPDVLAGPWSTLQPDPNADGFFQFGLRLDGVWYARDGKVMSATGNDYLLGRAAWNIVDPFHYTPQLEDFRRALPTTYTPAFPIDLFTHAFPNLKADHFSPDVLDAAATLFDVVCVGNLLRPLVPDFRYEFPLVAFLPSLATQDQSTNQGKTLAAECYGRVAVPGIEAVKIKEGDSAPDSRAAMDSIQKTGTAVLDEFQMPDTKSHILSRDNLQSLCVGKQVLAGKVYENTGSMRLAYSLTLSAKALQLNPDLVNRTLFWFLDNLTEEDRANAARLADIVSGKIPLQMRLGAWAIIEQHKVAEQLLAAPKASSPTWRFGCHRALATILYRIRQNMMPPEERSPIGAEVALDQALKQMRDRHRQQTMDADDNGLLTMLSEGRTVQMSLRAIFDGLGAADVQHIADWITANGHPDIVGTIWGGTQALLRGRLNVAGLSGRPLCALTQSLLGRALSGSDRMLGQIMAEEVRRMIPEKIAWVLPDHLGLAGWVLIRGTDTGGAVRVRLEQRKPESKK